MLKQSYSNSPHQHTPQHQIYLYDKVREDLFENNNNKLNKVIRPSITTICLLQIQAYIVKILAQLPPTTSNVIHKSSSSLSIVSMIENSTSYAISSVQFIIFQCIHWFLLLILLFLDNVARFLNVDKEMADFIRNGNDETHPNRLRRKKANKTINENTYLVDEVSDQTYLQSITDKSNDRDYYYIEQQKKAYGPSIELYLTDDNNHQYRYQDENGNSEPVSPTIAKRNTNSLVSPASPINSPTPNFVARTKKPSSPTVVQNNTSSSSTTTHGVEKSPVLAPSRARTGRIRSLSNNMVDQKKPMSPQKLRRITAQREITIQSGVLPIQPKSSKPHHHTHKKPPISTTESSLSRSSSGSSTTNDNFIDSSNRPKMKKTMSLSTAQQYQKQHNQCPQFRQSLNDQKHLKPFERCCTACTLSSHT